MIHRKKYIIRQLQQIGVNVNAKGNPLELLDYKELKYLLAVKRAAAQ